MELRLFSYEINHFNMALCKIKQTTSLNILNMDEWQIMKLDEKLSIFHI